jgi:hypothetical protein
MIENFQPYLIGNEYDFSEVIAHFDSNYIFSIINDKLQRVNYANQLPEPNVVQAFEENFKIMNQTYPGDSQNIRNIREQVYRQIIDILTNAYNLTFNTVDDTIDVFTAASYLYEFLVSRRNDIMTNFFVAFIVNNKDSLYNMLTTDGIKKSRDSSSNYGKLVYADQKYVTISSNMNSVIKYISEMDVTLLNIFQSTYRDQQLTMFLDNAFADKGNFFKDYYCSTINNPEIAPIVITNIKLALQRLVGNVSTADINTIINMNEEE